MSAISYRRTTAVVLSADSHAEPLDFDALDRTHATATKAWYRTASASTPAVTSAIRTDWLSRFERAGLSLHLQVGGEQAQLSIEDFAVPAEIEAAWRLPMPEPHRLALTEDMYGALLDELERWLGTRVVVCRVDPASLTPPVSALFGEWVDAKGAAIRFCWTGAEATVTRCLTRTTQGATPTPWRERSVIRSLPLATRLQLRCGSIHAAEHSGLRVGAAVLIPNAAGPMATAAIPVSLTSAIRGRGCRTLARGVVRGRQLSFLEVSPMRHDASTSDLEPADAGADFDQLPMLVTCEVGRLEMTVADLADLAPGMVVDLQAPLANLRGTLCVQGRPVAHGELVGVGSDIALRITSMLHAGAA